MTRQDLGLALGGLGELAFYGFGAAAVATSLATLAVFALVNLALLRLRYRGVRSDNPHVSVPIWIPAIGLVTCLAMMAGASFR